LVGLVVVAEGIMGFNVGELLPDFAEFVDVVVFDLVAENSSIT